jgi:two-component system, chemotaxis family, protein-glutamate methylesterase/glutaminase
MARIVVIAASAERRAVLADAVLSDPVLEVVAAIAPDQAVATVRRVRPDIALLDLDEAMEPALDTTRRLMASAPLPIVLVADDPLVPGGVSTQALDAGALAVVPLGSGATPEAVGAQQREVAETVALMAEVPVVTRRRHRRPHRADPGVPARVRVVGVAASTGGPAALATVLRGLPPELPAAVLVVQHIGPRFDEGLARWFADQTRHEVRLARDGDEVRSGRVLVAPTGVHLTVTGDRRARLSTGPPRNGHRPSADPLFAALAAVYGPAALGVILTGMGRDGVAGLVELRRAGGGVIAQDEATSVVYGMPAAAVAAGAVERVLPLDRIAEEIVRRVDAPQPPRPAAVLGGPRRAPPPVTGVI